MAVTSNIYKEGGVANLVFEIMGYSLLFMSALGRMWASAYIAGKKGKEFVATGPYSITRNPLYFFSFLGYIGVGMAFESLSLTVGMAALFFFTHWNTILSEEKGNHQRFGSVYEAYAGQVPRFIPDPRQFKDIEESNFYPKSFFRAFIGSSLIVLVFPLAHLIEWGHIHSIIPVLFLIP
ncbi:isoprenylcysteine carboxylmethyltransferase family protein [bacterium]|nr:isoprenylcysteine carboxylmethyltransferase family protein [bacterium]